MKTYLAQELGDILNNHKVWLNDENKGKRADLWGADLRGADLQGADLRGADLRGADLRDADLWGADLRGADLRSADLQGANLQGADLRSADLRSADLRGVDISFFQIVSEGTIIGYKKLQNNHIAVLEIPKKARRINGIGSRKCRAEYAKVIKIETLEGETVKTASSIHDYLFVYTVGKIVRPHAYIDDVRVECTSGIHFFLTKQEAQNYNG